MTVLSSFAAYGAWNPPWRDSKNAPKRAEGKLRQKTMPVTLPLRALWIHMLSAII